LVKSAEVVDRVAGVAVPAGLARGVVPSGVCRKPKPVMMPRPMPPPPPSCQAKSGVLISVAAADEVDLQADVAEVDLGVVGGAEVGLAGDRVGLAVVEPQAVGGLDAG
jgi:hypothetical protein